MSTSEPTYHELEVRCSAAEDRLAGIIEGMSEAFIALDENLVVTHFNATASRHLRHRSQDVVGEPLFQTFPELGGSAFEATVAEVQNSGRCMDFETYLDVAPYQNWYRMRVCPLGSGVSVYFTVTTDRKSAQEALRKSREQIRVIFEASPAGIFLVNEQGDVTVANRKMEELFGRSTEELIGMPYVELIHPAERSDGFDKMRALMAAVEDNVSLERRYVTKDGREFIGHLSGRRLFRADGSLEGLVGIISDITDQKRAEKALLASEQRYRCIFENAAVGIDVVDTGGKIVEVNRALARMLGYDEHELLDIMIFDLTHPDDIQVSRSKFDAMHEGKTDSYRMEKRYVKENGDIMWADVSVSPVLGTDGKHVATVKVIADITERIRAQAELRKSEQKYRDLFVGAPIGIFQTTVDGRVLSVNPAYARMYGYGSPDEVVSQIDNVAQSLYVSSERRKMLVDQALQTDGFIKAENHYRRKDGTTFWGQLYFHVVRDHQGHVKHLEGFVEDITDRKAAELALKDSEEKYRLLFDNSPLGLISVDRDGSILEINPTLLNILGSPSKESTKAINMFTFPLLIEAGISDALQSCISTGTPVQRDVPYVSTWGKESFMRILLTPVATEPGDVRGCQAIVEDIIHQKKLEDQLRQAQKMEAIGTLAGGIAHDFNNLLQIICGNAELLEMELDEKHMTFSELDAVRDAGQRGADLVKQILTFSRRVDTEFKSGDLNEDVRNAERLLYRTIPRMIEIVLKLEEPLKPARVDSTQIEQLLINLAINAKDAMPDGGTLTIETRNMYVDEQSWKGYEELVPGNYVLLRVSDTGHGMDAKVLEHIFEPFFTTKGLADGTGLGLATAFGIVKMHGGHITCSSEVGTGTVFDMYFPAVESVGHDSASHENMPEAAGGKETILVVDDEELIRILATRILEKSGYSVLTAGSGKEALELYRQRRSVISLVILDLLMPEMGGKQCLEELLKINPQVRSLIASGFAVEGDTKAFLDLKAKGMVAKPFRIQELLQSIRRVLDGI